MKPNDETVLNAGMEIKDGLAWLQAGGLLLSGESAPPWMGELNGIPVHSAAFAIRQNEVASIIANACRMRIAPVDYILALIDSFPCLRHKWEGKWDVDRFVKYSRPWSTGERYAAMFIASVWNPNYAAQKRWRFDVVQALGTWDRGNRNAFLAWANNPYWP